MIIRAYGLFWRADEITWSPGKGKAGEFRLLGRRGTNLPTRRVADFRQQRGLYILYGDYGPYYVGLTKKQDLGKRLKDHLDDHHADRWDRFSWFGFRQVLKTTENGLCKLKALPSLSLGAPEAAIADMEALLIKALGLASNLNKMNFKSADEWTQVRLHEWDKYSEG
jgi:hypothetical protein